MRALAVLLLVGTVLRVSADEQRRNPFAHEFDGPPAEAADVDEHLHEEELEVTAILVAGDRSLVTINGNVIGVGEESFGYRLMSVAEESATFLHEGAAVTISLFEERQGEEQRD